MKFDLKVINPDFDGDSVTLACAANEVTRCQVTYNRFYSPTLYYVNPPVVYSGAKVDIWFNPKSTMELIKDIASDNLPFINAKMDKALINFEGLVDSET